MPDLTPVGLSSDGSRLVLRSDTGGEFTVVVDHRFRAALRGDDTRLAQLEVSMHSALRPRDIQSRIRAGQSPEAVAAAAGTTVERISAFAAPVLAERAHVAERAQRATVRRRTGDGAPGLLADAVSERLHDGGVDAGGVEWDAWRRDDGRWTLVAGYRVAEAPRRAEFVYDAAGRYVVPGDEESRWLVGEGRPGARSRPAPAEQPAEQPAGQRDTALGVTSDDPGQLPLGEDAIELVTGVAAGSLTEDVAVVRTLPAPAREESGPAEPPEAAEPVDAAEPTEPSERTEPTEPSEAAEPVGRPRRPTRRAKGRAAVPSWDEIMFGSGGGD